MSDVETEVAPPDIDNDEEGDGDVPACRIAVHVLDVGDTHYDAALQLFGDDADDPDRGADALLRVALAVAQLRGGDHHWALMQRLVAYDGATS